MGEMAKALLYAELKIDALTERTTNNAARLDAGKAVAEQRFFERFAKLVDASGGRVLEGFREDLLRGSETIVAYAVIPIPAAAALTATRLVSAIGADGDGSRIELRLALDSMDEHAVVMDAGVGFGRCRALCAVGHPDQILVSATMVEALDSTASAPLHSLGQVRLPDLSPPQAVFQLGQEPAGHWPPLRALRDWAHNLPLFSPCFIGHVKERRDLQLHLNAQRLVTIVGGGGVGKTRLALQVAADVATRFDGGVWLVDLASLTNPDLVSETVAGVLGIEETTPQTSLDLVIARLANQQVLLLLDNCEHVLVRCRPIVERLVGACPQLRVMATSRRRLEAEGEFVFELDPLELSRDDLGASAEPTDAMRLFTVRAAERRKRAHAAPSIEDDIDALDRLCQLLEGNPLAIELATGRVHRWSVAEIYERVSQHYDALGEDPDAAHPRQSSLWATFEWSYQLLSPSARRLFRRLSVFRGGATSESIRAVITDDRLTESHIAEALSELVVGHLLMQIDRDHFPARYQQLETLRTFANDKLRAEDRAELFAERHALYMSELLIVKAPLLNSGQQGDVQRVLRDEHSNVRAALDWYVTRGVTADGLRLGIAMRRFWVTAGFHNEGRHYLKRLLEQVHDGINAELHGNALYCLATLTSRQSDFDAANLLLERSLTIAQERNDVGLLGKVHNALGGICWRRGQIALAQHHYGIALNMLQEMEHEVGISTVLNSLAVTHLFAAQIDQAQLLLERSLALAREIRNERSVMDGLNNLAIVHGIRGDYGTARSHLAECMRILRGHEGDRRFSLLLHNLAHVAFRQGRHDDARQLCETAISKQEAIGDQSGILLSHLTLGAIELDAGELESAAEHFTSARVLVENLGELGFRCDVAVGLGRVALARGELDEAASYLESGLHDAKAMPNRQMEATALVALGVLKLRRGDKAAVRSHLTKALAIRQDLGNRRGIAETIEAFAELNVLEGRTLLAVRQFAFTSKVRAAIGAPLPKLEERQVGRVLSELRARLGDDTFEAAWAPGGHATPADVVQEALHPAPAIYV